MLKGLLRHLGRGIATVGLAASLFAGCSEEDPTEPIITTPPPIVKNHSPVITSTPPTTANEKRVYSYQLRATDQDGDPLTCLIVKPSWLSISPSWMVSGTAPEVSSDQVTDVELRVSDKESSVSQKYYLTIKNIQDVYVLPSDQLNQLIGMDSTKLSFSQPVNFAPGDIIGAGITEKTPDGLLREINSISNDKKTVFTSQATLEQVVEDAFVSYSGKLLPSQIASFSSLKGVQTSPVSPTGLDFSIPIKNVVLYDFDGDTSTTLDQLVANGNISFSTDVDFSIRIDNHRISDINFKNSTTLNSDISVGSNSMGVARTYQIKIAEYRFKPLVIAYLPAAIPIPVIVTPKLAVSVGINPSLLNPLSVRVQDNASLDIGLHYDGSWNPSATFSNEFTFSNPVLKRDMELSVSAGPSLEMMLYGIAGPFASLGGRLRLKSKEGGWELYGGLVASLGVKMEVLKKGFSAQFKEAINYEKLLAKSSISTLDGKILFVSGTSFDPSKVYTVKDDGSNLEEITAFPAWSSEPRSSPDGKKLVFVSNKDGNNEIYSMNLDGSSLARLTSNSSLPSNSDTSPDWSPDGREIVFSSNRSSQISSKSTDIYLMNSDGSDQRKMDIPAELVAQGFPSWSPDGQKIAFDATTDGSHFNIYTVNKDGTGLTKITDDLSLNTQASWSRDGTKIAFTSNRDGDREIYVMNSNGTNAKRLTNSPGYDIDPFWLPDGRIVFISARDGGYNNLHIMNSDGSGVKNIETMQYHYDETPSYMPSQ